MSVSSSMKTSMPILSGLCLYLLLFCYLFIRNNQLQLFFIYLIIPKKQQKNTPLVGASIGVSFRVTDINILGGRL